jgi:pimeloyl-ACP methyl ester carboxylesterase
MRVPAPLKPIAELEAGATIWTQEEVMPKAINGDVTIHYQDEGFGDPVLLIHGHTMDRRIWDTVVPSLLDADLRIVRPDLRGHGRSTRPDFGYHASHHASDMAAVLDEAGIESATVVGYSIGGAIALEMALTMADRLHNLVLMSPVMPDRPFEPAFMDNLREVARVAREEGIEAAMLGPWASSPIYEHSVSKPGVRDVLMAVVRDFPGAEYLATQRDRVDRDWTVPERLSEIRAPTMIVAGDRETPGFRSYAVVSAAGIPGARLEFFEDCGHLLPLEEPDRVAEVIIEVVVRGCQMG